MWESQQIPENYPDKSLYSRCDKRFRTAASQTSIQEGMLLLHGASSMASVSHKLKGKPKNSSSLEISPVSKLFLLPALIR